MKRTIISIAILCTMILSVYAGDIFSLTRVQQNRLNTFIKQIKLPVWEYKLSVTSSGSRLERYTLPSPEVQVVEKERIVTETKILEVPKYIITEKFIQDPRISTGSIIISPSEIFALVNKCVEGRSICSYNLLQSKGVDFNNP